jgi:hypothetical protein
MKLKKLPYSFYLLPSISLQWDRYYEGDYAYVQVDIEWLKWKIELVLWES